MTNEQTFCSKVITVPQFGQNCWFLALFMSMFYSQRSRIKLLQASKTWNEDIEIFKILKNILHNKYLKTNEISDFEYFKVISAEKLLGLLHEHDSDNFEFDPTQADGYHVVMYINKLYKFLNLNTLSLDLENENLYYSLYNNYQTDNQDKTKVRVYFQIEKNIEKKLEKIPDIITVFTTGNKNRENLYSKYPHYKIKNQNNGLNTLNDTIFYNDEEYVLDSIILSNWNLEEFKLGAHTICGITCKNERYLYNGWVKSSIDPNITKLQKINDAPCQLMKFNWDPHKDINFCLDTEKCRPSFAKTSLSKDLCFSFKKSEKMLIYVKKSKIDQDEKVIKSNVLMDKY